MYAGCESDRSAERVFVERGDCVEQNEVVVESYLTNLLMSKASSIRVPLSGTFELSPICNFACKMCYVRKTLQEVASHNRTQMSKEQWLEIAKTAREKGLLYLLLTGGEPFLWPDFWELYDELSGMGFVISINTNGSLIDEKVVERLVKKPPSRVNITLYGACDETYEALCGVKNVFSKIDRAIQMLKKAGILVKLNCSLTPQNACDLEKVVQYSKDNDLILAVNTYMFPPIRRDASSIGKNERFTPVEAVKYNMDRFRLQFGEERYRGFLENIKNGAIYPPGLDEGCVNPIDGQIRCRAGNASFWITWDGFMTPCGMMTEPKIDITAQGFHKAWEELTKISEQIKLSGICVKCPNQKLCHACAAMALAETGSFQGIPTYLCEMVVELRKQAENEINKEEGRKEIE